MRIKSQILSLEEKDIIHSKSIKILENVGLKFPSETALDLLSAGGAKVDRDRNLAYISMEMVERALEQLPKTILLGARNKECDLHMPSLSTTYHMDGCSVNITDFDTGKKRTAVTKDLATAARIFDEMSLGSIFWPCISPEDAPHGARSIVSSATGFLNTAKHIQDEVKDLRELYYVLEITRAMAGGEEARRLRNLYSVVYCTIAPLCHDKEMLEANIEVARAGIPIVVLPMPACGTTGPASLYSNIALANAEALSAIVMLQLAAPGCPLIYGTAQGISNANNGMFLFGAPETSVQYIAMIEMAKYYHMPVTAAGCTTDAKAPGMQTVMEKVMTTLPLVLADADTIVGYGMYECSGTVDFAQIVLDNEIAEHCGRIKEGVTISGDLDFFEDIEAVAPGGHYLKRKNTRKAFRTKEFYMPRLLDRGSYDEWKNGGEKDMYCKARDEVRKILTREQKNPMDETLQKQIGEIVEEAKAKLI